MLLALVIGLVISTPLTLQIFKAEIDSELIAMHQAELESFEKTSGGRRALLRPRRVEGRDLELESALVAGVPADIVSANPEVAALSAQLALVETAYNAAEQEVACEKDGTCGSGVVGAGPAFEEKKDRRDRLASERALLQARVAAMTAQVRRAPRPPSRSRPSTRRPGSRASAPRWPTPRRSAPPWSQPATPPSRTTTACWPGSRRWSH